jgi:hypothetical protein
VLNIYIYISIAELTLYGSGHNLLLPIVSPHDFFDRIRTHHHRTTKGTHLGRYLESVLFTHSYQLVPMLVVRRLHDLCQLAWVGKDDHMREILSFDGSLRLKGHGDEVVDIPVDDAEDLQGR